jgi:hypothetical protein
MNACFMGLLCISLEALYTYMRHNCMKLLRYTYVVVIILFPLVVFESNL